MDRVKHCVFSKQREKQIPTLPLIHSIFVSCVYNSYYEFIQWRNYILYLQCFQILLVVQLVLEYLFLLQYLVLLWLLVVLVVQPIPIRLNDIANSNVTLFVNSKL